MNVNCLGRGLISKIYRCLVDGSTEMSAGQLEARREDLQEAIPIKKWEEACSKAQSKTTNTHLKLLQYNWLMRRNPRSMFLTAVDEKEIIDIVKKKKKKVKTRCLLTLMK